jgi:hypothetical protein
MDAYFPQAYKIGKNFPGHPVRCGKNKFVLSDGERDILMEFYIENGNLL